MLPDIQAVEAPSDADREAILRPLLAYNAGAVGTFPVETVAFVLRDEQGDIVGGLWGRISYDWLFVELLSVAERWRGRDLGTGLMEAAERRARERGCRGLWLDTYAFQARGFYEKLGFSVFGVLEDHPVGSRRYFLAKVLSGAG